jgi:PAS domain S-box-containing protein
MFNSIFIYLQKLTKELFNKFASHSRFVAWSILIVSSLITYLGWNISNKYVTLNAQENFDFAVTAAADAIAKRMLEYEQVLRGGAGLFNAKGMVSRKEWRTYVETLKINTYWPGIQGLGFSLYMLPNQVQPLIKSIRQEGFREFNIRPEGTREQYTAIIYLEPFKDRNLRAFGYDMMSEPVRRMAMNRARDTGNTAVSGKVTLVQETSVDIQYGFLMYFPVYRQESLTETIDQRRQNLLGFVYSPFRIQDLLHGVLGDNTRDLSFQLYDGDSAFANNLLYKTSAETETEFKPQFKTHRRIQIGGHTWVVEFQSREIFESELSSNVPFMIAIAGFLIDLLLFLIIWSISSQKKKIQGEIQKATQELTKISMVIEQSPNSVIITNTRPEIEYANPAALEATGYSRNELLGQNPRIFKSGKTASHLYQDMWYNLTHGKSWHGEFINRKKTGELYDEYVIVTPIKKQSGEISHYVCEKQDITEKKKLQNSRDESLVLLQNVIESSEDAIRIKDNKFRTLTCNSKFAELVERPINDLIGKTDLENNCFHKIAQQNPSLDQTDIDRDDRQVLSGHTIRFLLGIASLDSSIRFYDVIKQPVWDNSKNITGVLDVSRDITDRRNMEIALKNAKELAEKSTKSKSEFLAKMSHEIRTPMNAIIGFAEIGQVEQDPKARGEYFDHIHQSAQHLLNIINDILDFSKIEAGKLNLEYVKFELGKLMSELHQTMRYAAIAKGIELSFKLPSTMPIFIMADRLRLYQILLNLLNNALKFTNAGKVELEIAVLSERDSKIELSFTVSDTGIGMTEEEQTHLFQAFNQAHSSTTRLFGGTGLGLAISQSLVHKFGGKIKVRSEVNKGSQFSFSLQFERVLDTNGRPFTTPFQQEDRNLHGMQVLIVDDNAINQKVVAVMLKKMKAIGTLADNGEIAVQLLRDSTQHFDVILMDIHMPVMDGYTATRKIRTELDRKDLIIIAQTANAFKDEETKCLALGMNGYLSKPITMEKLYQALSKYRT